MILNDIILKNVVVFTFLGIFCIFAFMEKKLIYYFSATGNSLALAKEYAKNLLQNEKIPTIVQIDEMDEIFIQKNLSAGGSADLLALTYFIYGLEELAVEFD